MDKFKWTNYKEAKPSSTGTYLVIFEYSNKQKPVGDVAYYHPTHGWTGAANTLEKSIIKWAPFPWPNSK